jgi:hypothetical protein
MQQPRHSEANVLLGLNNEFPGERTQIRSNNSTNLPSGASQYLTEMCTFRALFKVSIKKITKFATLTYNFIISTVRIKVISFEGKGLLEIKIMVQSTITEQVASSIISDVC